MRKNRTTRREWTDRSRAVGLGVEPLEGRRLLSASRSIVSGGALYDVTLDGPGALLIAPNRDGVDLGLFGTTDASTLSVTLARTSAHYDGNALGLGRVIVRTGELGAIDAADGARLTGTVSPLRSDVSRIAVAGIDPEARLQINGDLGTLEVRHNVTLGPSGLIQVNGDVTGPIAIGGDVALTGGHFLVGRDVTGPVTIGGNLTLDAAGAMAVGRDLSGGVAIDGNLTAGPLSGLATGRDLGALTVAGNLDLSAGGSVLVGGDLGSLDVTGTAVGDYVDDGDVSVGLTIGSLTVAGGGANVPSIRGLDVVAGKNIQGLNVAHGIFESRIAAGVLIDGGPGTLLDGANVGPDGPVAVRNSEITAGVVIRDLVIGGDVVLDRTIAGNRPTRIVAGLDPLGNPINGASIDAFQISGELVDAAIAASVYPGPDGTYDAPAGTITGGTVSHPIRYPNATAPPYDPSQDPTIDDVVNDGTINLSLVPPPPAADAGPDAKIPLPARSTVLGGVISTRSAADGGADFAGLYARDTRGVFVGLLP